jgi:predicted HAD superfamily Cof-like phosphohydrolase
MTEEVEAENARLRAQVKELQATMTRLVEERRADDLHCQVYAFNRKIGLPTNSVPVVPDDATVRSRLLLSASELCEQLQACFHLNPAIEHALLDEIRYAGKLRVRLPEIVDAWADSSFANQGSAIIFGVDMKPIAREVARSNMTKKRENLRADGSIIKDADFSPPQIERLLREQGWQGRTSTVHPHSFSPGPAGSVIGDSAGAQLGDSPPATSIIGVTGGPGEKST